MKKLIFSTLCICALIFTSSTVGFAQVKQYDYEVAGFNSVTITDDFQVNIVPGNTYGVKFSVNEDYRDALVCEVKKSNLTIGIDEKIMLKNKKNMKKSKDDAEPVFKAIITVADPLMYVTLQDKAVLFDAAGAISEINAEFGVSDNAVMKPLSIKSRDVKITMEKKAVADLSVECDFIEVSASGTSSLNLSQQSKKTSIESTNFANIVLHGTTESLTYKGKAASKAIINGSSKVAAIELSGTTNVNASNLVLESANINMNGLCQLIEAATENIAVDLSNGSTLVFNNHPTVEVLGISKSTMLKYDDKRAKSIIK